MLFLIESESEVKVAQLCPTLCDPMDYSIHGILQARILEWVDFPFSRDSSQPQDRTQISHTAGNSLAAEPQGKPKNTGVGSLSLLQRIFPPPSNWTMFSCIAARFFTSGAIREAPYMNSFFCSTPNTKCSISKALKNSLWWYQINKNNFSFFYRKESQI